MVLLEYEETNLKRLVVSYELTFHPTFSFKVLKERLSMMISPFEGYPARDPWPNAVPVDTHAHPTWLLDEMEEKRLRRGKWRDLDIRD